MTSTKQHNADDTDILALQIGQLGHKMGQHLMVAEGYATMLQSKIPDDTREYEYLAKIRHQIVMMGDIKQQMMEFARPATSSAVCPKSLSEKR